MGEKWAGGVVLQPVIPKSDRLLGADTDAAAARLDAAAHERLAGIAHPRRRAQFIAVRSLLWQALTLRHGASAQTWRLDAGGGKPRLMGDGAPHISLTHSRDLVACAIAEVAVGIDLEHCRERDFSALLEQLGQPGACRGRLPGEQADCFYRLWTLREARFKLHGREPPEVALFEQHAFFRPEEGFLGAVAVAAGEPVRLRVMPD